MENPRLVAHLLGLNALILALIRAIEAKHSTLRAALRAFMPKMSKNYESNFFCQLFAKMAF
jgi:hypothetical protein